MEKAKMGSFIKALPKVNLMMKVATKTTFSETTFFAFVAVLEKNVGRKKLLSLIAVLYSLKFPEPRWAFSVLSISPGCQGHGDAHDHEADDSARGA